MNEDTPIPTAGASAAAPPQPAWINQAIAEGLDAEFQRAQLFPDGVTPPKPPVPGVKPSPPSSDRNPLPVISPKPPKTPRAAEPAVLSDHTPLPSKILPDEVFKGNAPPRPAPLHRTGSEGTPRSAAKFLGDNTPQPTAAESTPRTAPKATAFPVAWDPVLEPPPPPDSGRAIKPGATLKSGHKAPPAPPAGPSGSSISKMNKVDMAAPLHRKVMLAVIAFVVLLVAVAVVMAISRTGSGNRAPAPSPASAGS